MARKRMIDPSIWTDEGMAALTARQQLLFIGLFSNADDDGRLRASPQALRLMMPTIYQDSADPDAEVKADLLAVCRQIRQLVHYEVEGRAYLAFQTYARWQRIDRPSRSTLPGPLNEGIVEASTNDRRGVAADSERTPASIDRLVEEKLDRSEEIGSGGAPRANALTPPKQQKPKPSISDDERAVLVRDFGPVLGADLVNEKIALALSHANARKYADQYLYVRNWIRRDAEDKQEKQAHGRKNTSGPGAARNGPGVGQTGANRTIRDADLYAESEQRDRERQAAAARSAGAGAASGSDPDARDRPPDGDLAASARRVAGVRG